MIKQSSITAGLSFGLTSGVITTLGLLIGLEAGTGSRTAVLAGILTIAVADALSDALGMHIAEESDKKNNRAAIWQTTITTFLVKFFIATTFIIPVILLSMDMAVIVSAVWGLFLIITLTFFIARKQKKNPWKSVSEHVLISIVVIVTTYYVGNWVASL
ncbi:MAG: hypothetical protein Q8Q23_01045 [bacterium]|nr:hypothetical protein [bacterium]